MTIIGWCCGCDEQLCWDGKASHLRLVYRTPAAARWQGCGPVWPGVRVHDQAGLEERAPGLLLIEAPGHWVEWVPRGRLSLGSVPIGDGVMVEILTGHRWTREHGYLPGDDGPRLRWLRISANPGGPPVDIADVRAVVREARKVGVPVWIERLGRTIERRPVSDRTQVEAIRNLGCTIEHVHHTDYGPDISRWPEDLRLRELPEENPE